MIEAGGHESVFFAEHPHIPASRERRIPATGELPRKYSHTYALSAQWLRRYPGQRSLNRLRARPSPLARFGTGERRLQPGPGRAHSIRMALGPEW